MSGTPEYVYGAASDVCDKIGDHNKHTFDVVVWGIETALEAQEARIAELERRNSELNFELGGVRRSYFDERKKVVSMEKNLYK